jgi:hypothetical protein
MYYTTKYPVHKNAVSLGNLTFYVENYNVLIFTSVLAPNWQQGIA